MADILEQAENQTSEEAKLLEEIRQEADRMKNQSYEEVDTSTKEQEVTKSNEAEAESSQQAEETDAVEQESTQTEEESKAIEKSDEAKEKDISSMVFETPIMIKNRGLNLPVNNMAELIKMAEMGVDYTRKTQEIAPYRKTVELIKSTGIDESDLQLLADIKAGNKTAINGLAEKYQIDLLDVDPSTKYKQQVSLPLYNEADIVAQEIMANQPLAQEFQRVAQFIPNDFKDMMAKDANLLRSFAVDVENGVAQQLLPEVTKIMTLNPGVDFITAYVHAGDKIFGSQAQVQQQVQPQAKQAVVNAPASAKEKAGVVAKAPSAASSESDIDIWKDGLSESDIVAKIREQANRMRVQSQNKGY